MNSLVAAVMQKEDMTEDEARDLCKEARRDLDDRLGRGEQPFDICEEWFGLEPDYMMDLLEI